jgi:hypothetical protein
MITDISEPELIYCSDYTSTNPRLNGSEVTSAEALRSISTMVSCDTKTHYRIVSV